MPRQILALAALQPAFRHTWRQLFQPFRLGLWARLALVGIATGDIPGCGGGGGGNGAGGGSGEGDQLLALASGFPFLFPLIFVGAILAITLILGWIYLASVLRFVLLDIVLTDRYRLIDGFRRWQRPGFSYFFWQLAYLGVLIAALAIVVGILALAALLAGVSRDSNPSITLMIIAGLWLVVGLTAVIAAVIVVWILARDFLVPVMALERVGALEAWNRLLPMLVSEKLNYAVYLLIRMFLTMVAFILCLVLVLVFLLALGGVGLTLFLAGLWAEWSWNFYTIALAVVFGGAALVVTVCLIAFLCTPAVAFFPTYAAHFLGLRYARLSEALGNHPVWESRVSEAGG